MYSLWRLSGRGRSRMRACKVVGRLCWAGSFACSWDRSEASMPMAECIFEGSVQYLDPNVEKALDRVTIPPHLLFLRHTLRDDLVDCRFGEPGRYLWRGTRRPCIYRVSNNPAPRFPRMVKHSLSPLLVNSLQTFPFLCKLGCSGLSSSAHGFLVNGCT
jgi:hypothetical protein